MIRQIRRGLASSRFSVALAALGTFVSSVTLLVYGGVAVVRIAWGEIRHDDATVEGARPLSVEFIEPTDVFLLGTLLSIVALGLFQLFVDPHLPLPAWLQVDYDDLDDLKKNLVGVVPSSSSSASPSSASSSAGTGATTSLPSARPSPW